MRRINNGVSFASCIAVIALLLAAPLVAGRVSGSASVSGEPAEDVLISVEGLEGPANLAAETVRLEHRGRRFVPSVLPVAVGSTVEFRNKQNPACRLYTVSDGEEFSLKRSRGTVRSIEFDQPGVVEVRCKDHPDHHAYIVVKRNRYFALTGKSGRYDTPAIPEGEYVIQAWADGRVLEEKITRIGPDDASVDFQIQGRPRTLAPAPTPEPEEPPSTLLARAAAAPPPDALAPPSVDPDPVTSDEFLRLGVRQNYQKVERYNIVEQINTFIPPLFQPAFVGHGYVLPPGALRITTQFSSINVDSNDFFKGGETDLGHEHHSVDRTRQDIDFFYGLDHNMTVRVNIPFWSTRSVGSVHPAGVQVMDLFVEGNSRAVGDISVMLKKKWVDQANFYFNFATVTGIKLRNASNHEKFDSPMVVKMPNDMLGVAFDGGVFTRFTDDGRLPQVLQPGTGDFGYILGFMGTRQFTGSRAALHAGTLLRFLRGSDGVEPGDETRFFASFVKPVYKEKVSLDLTFNGMNKDKDKYSGIFGHPIPNPDGTLKGFAMTPRPPFRGGTVMFVSPSLIWNPRPQIRLTATASFRVKKPDLGPWPGTIVQFGMTYTLPFYREQRLR